MKGKAIVSLNDHPEIRRVFEGFHIEIVDIHYTVGGGKGAARREVVIYSWDDRAEPAGLFEDSLTRRRATGLISTDGAQESMLIKLSGGLK